MQRGGGCCGRRAGAGGLSRVSCRRKRQEQGQGGQCNDREGFSWSYVEVKVGNGLLHNLVPGSRLPVQDPLAPRGMAQRK